MMPIMSIQVVQRLLQPDYILRGAEVDDIKVDRRNGRAVDGRTDPADDDELNLVVH
jgi:hypothetical protein